MLGTATKIPGPDSAETLFSNQGEQIAIAHGIPPRDSVVAILSSERFKAQDKPFIDARESLVALLREQVDSLGQQVFSSVKTLGHSWVHEDSFVSKDSRHVLIVAASAAPVYETPQILRNLPAMLDSWRGAHEGFTLDVSSSGLVSNELFSLINHDLDKSLQYTIPITILILVWTFRSLASSIIALGLTGLSLAASLGIAALCSHVFGAISATAAQLIVLLVMAVGTDYSLFFITRLRQEVLKGQTYDAAVAVTSRTTGVAIFWSGLTVAVSLTGLLLANDPILSSMAVVSIVSVLVTLFYTLRVLPALLCLLQSNLEWGKLRAAKARQSGTSRSWILWSTRKPKSALFLSSIVLLSLGAFCIPMRLGSTMQPEFLPKQMPSSAASRQFSEHFPELSGTDLSIILYSPNLSDQDSSGQLQEFLDEIQSQERVRAPLAIEWAADRSVVRYRFSIRGTSQDQANEDLVYKIKETLLPTYIKSSGVQGAVSGKLVYDIEQEAMYRHKIALVFGSILFVSFVFLLIAFESLVIPLKALVLNLLSSAAAFGLLVLFFQMYGWRYGVIESFVPSLLFSVLFGLSMDYHLFLLSTIQEEVRAGASTVQAVQSAISKTYAVISSAAVIMASVFVVISLLDLPLMKQLGLGLAFAVILDATIIRCVLLPASVVLLGEMNWYMPHALRRVVRKLKSGSA